MRRFLKWTALGTVLIAVLLLAPAAYVEAFCRADPDQAAYEPIIKDEEFQRSEANSYLTYPEWHIVYAYEGLAKVLQTGDEHEFGFFASVAGFWRSFCSLNRKANSHGGGDFNTRGTVHTIGVSFTLEMALKALYEETIGRLFAVLRGAKKTDQDVYAAKMADDYARFLQQVPWYKYDFDSANKALWALPATSLRSFERRFALGLEWEAKTAYAQMIAGAVAAAGEAKLEIRSVVRDLPADQLSQIDGVVVLGDAGEGVLIETPRYRNFTVIVQTIADAGGQIVEIAGNNDIMVSVIEPFDAVSQTLGKGELISRIGRDGYDSNRILVGVKVADLASFVTDTAASSRQLEHIYDY